MRIVIEPGDLSLRNTVGVFALSMALVAGASIYLTYLYLTQKLCAQPIGTHRTYPDLAAPTPQTPLVHAGTHYGNGFWRSDLVTSKTQVQWNLRGDDRRQNVPFRVNASTDVPVDFVTDMSCGVSYLAVSMDKNALGNNQSGDPDYSAIFGWSNTKTGSIYFDRKSTLHDNGAVYIHVGGSGLDNGRPNHVMIGDDYVMPFGMGKPGQVITVPASGNQLVWSTPG